MTAGLALALSAPLFAQESEPDPPSEAPQEATTETQPDAAPEQAPDLGETDEPEYRLEDSDERRKLWFYVGVYGWVSAIEGDVYELGRKFEIDISMEEVLDYLDRALFVYTEAHYGRFFAAFQGSFVELSDDESGRLLDVDVDIEQEIFELRFGYEVYRQTLGSGSETRAGWPRELVFDVFAGTRYTSLDVTVDTRILDAGTLEVDLDGDTWDVIIGARVKADLSDRLFLIVSGDVGGFGIDGGSEFSWQAQGAFGYRLAHYAELLLGYRAIGTDTVSGSPRKGIDWVQHGLYIGFGFRF